MRPPASSLTDIRSRPLLRLFDGCSRSPRLTALFFLLREGQTVVGATGSVQVTGSESMRLVVAACAEEFMAKNPKADIVVKGGGSGDGVAAILHGIADIGMTSRDLYAARTRLRRLEGHRACRNFSWRATASPSSSTVRAGSPRSTSTSFRHLHRQDPQLARTRRRRCGNHGICARDRLGHGIAVRRPRSEGAPYAASVDAAADQRGDRRRGRSPRGRHRLYEPWARCRTARNSVKPLALRTDEQSQAAVADGGRGPLRALSAVAHAAPDRAPPRNRHGERIRRLLPRPGRSGARAQGRLHRHRRGERMRSLAAHVRPARACPVRRGGRRRWRRHLPAPSPARSSSGRCAFRRSCCAATTASGTASASSSGSRSRPN